jgi:hypothetical protein
MACAGSNVIETSFVLTIFSEPKTDSSPTTILNPGNVSGLIANKGPLNTLQSIQKPQAFGDQIKDITKQQIIQSATKWILTKLLR